MRGPLGMQGGTGPAEKRRHGPQNDPPQAVVKSEAMGTRLFEPAPKYGSNRVVRRRRNGDGGMTRSRGKPSKKPVSRDDARRRHAKTRALRRVAVAGPMHASDILGTAQAESREDPVGGRPVRHVLAAVHSFGAKGVHGRQIPPATSHKTPDNG